MIFGYARVSTADQNLDLQISALKEAGCQKIYEDKISGVRVDRPGLNSVWECLRVGDTLVVWRLDRLGRSLKELINLVEELEKMGVALRSLTDCLPLDTSTASGKLMLGLIALLAEFERNLIRERTCAGLATARARGRKGGRRCQHSDGKIAAAHAMAANSSKTIVEICKDFGISKHTFYSRAPNKKDK